MDDQPSDRVREVLVRLADFLDGDVHDIATELERRRAGRAALDPTGTLSPEVWEARREVARRSAAAGFYNLHLPEDMGGGGLHRTEMLFVEEAVYARGLGITPAVLAWTEGPSPMLATLEAEQRDRFLAPLMTGATTTAFALTEPQAGSDLRGLRTTATKDGDEWVLSGHKAFITNAPFCDVAQVTAVTNAATGELTMFLVEADRPGFRRGETYRTIMGDGLTGEIVLDGVRVPDANRVGEPGQGFALAMTWVNWRRLCRGGMCAGWGSYLIRRAVERARSRQAFGAAIGGLQAVQHMLADMQLQWHQARSSSLIAQAELDRLGPFRMPLDPRAVPLISLVKLANDTAFFRVADLAVQLHGATGLLEESPEATLFRIARNLRVPAGTDEIQKNAIAAGLLGSAK